MLTHTFDPIEPNAEESYTIDVKAKGWLAAGDEVNTTDSVFSTTATGVTLVSQGWDADKAKATVRIKGVTADDNAYRVTLLIVTDLRSIPVNLYIRVQNAPA